MNSISVITPTYRVGKALLEFVQSVHSQLKNNDELIIIDNDENPYSKKISRLRNVYYQRSGSNKGPCFARNFGLRQAKNEWLLFLDDDGLASPGMLDSLKSIIQDNPQVYAIRGRIKPKSIRIYNYLQGHYDLGEIPIPFFLNLEGIVAIKKNILQDIGGWNESLFGHEGEELTYRLLLKYPSKGCIYHPDLIFYHDFSDSLLKYLRKDNRHAVKIQELDNQFKELKPLIDEYKNKTTWKHEMIDDLALPLQRKIRRVLGLQDICRRRPVFREMLFMFLKAAQKIGIRI